MRAKSYILVVTFFAGMSTMSLEISASRLLAPYFGTSIFVWTNIIGIVLISLSLGYYYGGRLADEKATKELLSMNFARLAVKSESLGIFYASLLGSAMFLAPPTLLLASIVPISLKLYYAAGLTENGSKNKTEIARMLSMIFTLALL